MTEKTNLLRAFIGLFTRNWGLKLIALLLAILIYHALKPTSQHPSQHHDRQFNIQY